MFSDTGRSRAQSRNAGSFPFLMKRIMRFRIKWVEISEWIEVFDAITIFPTSEQSAGFQQTQKRIFFRQHSALNGNKKNNIHLGVISRQARDKAELESIAITETFQALKRVMKH